MKTSKLVASVILLAILLMPSSRTQAQNSAILENFFGEGSFMDGYDFSAGAVQRYGEYGPDNPSLSPDFYLGDSNTPVTTPEYHSPKTTIDYGTVSLNSITEIPSPSDTRFNNNVFYSGHTYGMITNEGDYIVLQVIEFYEEPLDDDYKIGMVFDWIYVSGSGGDGELTLSVSPYYDKPEFTSGDSIRIGIDVSMSGVPLAGADVTVNVHDLAGNTFFGASFVTDDAGHITVYLEYGVNIPLGFSGDIIVETKAVYGTQSNEQGLKISYGAAAVDQTLSLVLFGPEQPIIIGGWEDIGIAGAVTSQGMNVDGALVTMKVAGQTFQTTTGTHTTGQFNWYWANNSFPAGNYWVEVTITKEGYQSVTDSVPFTLLGEGYNYWVIMDPIPASLPPGDQVPFQGTLTLGGEPLFDWIEVDVTFPNGRTITYLYETGEDGRFFHFQPSMNEIGTYQLVVFRYDNREQISDVYTFSVGATPTPTATSAPPQPTPVSLICEIIDVIHPSIVFVGENIDITGKVVCTEGADGEEIIPQEGWDIHVSGLSPYESPVKAPIVQTNGDGSFTATLTPEVFYIQELAIVARHPEIETRYARWFGPLSVVVGIEPDVRLSQTDYDQGEIIEGELTLNSGSFAQDWDSGLEIYYQISGPIDGASKQYLFESDYYYVEGIDRFYWTVPHDAGGGKYTLTAYISGWNIATQSIEVDFYVNDIRHTNLTAVVEPAADGWSSASLAGQFTDFEGVPIPDAGVRVLFYELQEPYREFSLTGTTDTLGKFEINLEPLDLFAGQGQENPWLDRIWSTTVYADKEGYATGAAIIQTRTPTVKSRMEIISVNPSLDHLSELAQGGLSYEQFTEMNIQVQVRYNNIYGDGAKLTVSAEGNWAVSCPGSKPGDSPVILKADISINGEQKPEWKAYTQTASAYENMSAWHFPGSPINHWYYYPKYEVKMPAQKGISQESTITVSGKLFGYAYDKDSSNQCGGSAYQGDSSLIPPAWVGARPVVKIQVNLGSSSAVVYYNITPPSISVNGTAWVSPTEGEFKAKLNIGQATGYILSNQKVNLSIFAKDIESGEEKSSSEITVQSSASTDDKGVLTLPLTAKTNPCELEEKATYAVKVTSSAFEGEREIPIELRCVKSLSFELNDANISVVQVVDLSDNSPIQLVANKEAGVRVYMFVDGEIYQPTSKPVQFDVKFEMMVEGDNTPLFPQTKTVSLSEKGASVSWSPQSRAVNEAGIGEILNWETKPDGESGRELVYVDFVFTPHQLGSQSDFNIRITVDPGEVYGKKETAERPVTVKKMKHLQILFVPVDVQKVDMALVWEQVKFLQETYPLGDGDIGWGIAPNYASADMPFKWTTSYLDQICAALAKRYGSAAGGDTQFMVVGLIQPDTWRAGMIDKWAGVDTALGVHFKSSPQVVLLKHAANEPNTMAHELGHAYGLFLDKEQYDSSPPNGRAVSGLILRNSKIYNIPSDRSDGSQLQWIGAFGGKVENYQKLVDNGRKFNAPMDIFSLMGNARGAGQKSWVDADTYHQLFDKLKDPPGDAILLVQGLVNEDFDVILEPVWAMAGLPDLVLKEGVYTLQLVSSNGDVLYETRFGEKDTAPNSVLPFYLQIPWMPGIDRLRILDGDAVKSELLRTPNPPQFDTMPVVVVAEGTVIVLIDWSATDLDGDVLTYSLHYQCDNTTFWFPLASDLLETSYTFNTSGLPGGENCRVRVMVSDGFNTTEILTDPFFVLPKVAEVHIFLEETSYEAESVILLRGMAFDPEDGILPNSNLHWFSDIDGELGVGSSISVMLSPGTHNLILSAQDSAGNISLANGTIEVESGEILTGLGEGLQSLWLIGALLLGGVFILWLLIRKRGKPQPINIQQGDKYNRVQDMQGRWWVPDPNTDIWNVWNGEAWQPVPGVVPNIAGPQQGAVKKQRGRGSCLLSLLISGVLGLIVIGGISLVAFNIFPAYQIEIGQGDLNQILKMGGGGLIVAILGLLLFNGGFKAIITRRAVIENESGRQSEKRGCSAILYGIGQLLFGAVLFMGGLGLLTLVFYQEILPYLGF